MWTTTSSGMSSLVEALLVGCSIGYPSCIYTYIVDT